MMDGLVVDRFLMQAVVVVFHVMAEASRARLLVVIGHVSVGRVLDI